VNVEDINGWTLVDLCVLIMLASPLIMTGISIFVEAPRIPNVHYEFVDESSLTRNSLFGVNMNADGTTINGPVKRILVKEDTIVKNLVIRHENCHARQYMENRSISEIECYARMMFVWEDEMNRREVE
jgi:hypothetical protein